MAAAEMGSQRIGSGRLYRRRSKPPSLRESDVSSERLLGTGHTLSRPWCRRQAITMPSAAGLTPVVSFPRAQRGGCRAGRGALATISRAGRAHQCNQDLIVCALRVVCAGNNAERSRRTRIALWPRRSWRTGRTCRALRSRFAALASRPGRPLCTSFALRTLRTNWSLRARWAGCATLTGRALRTNGALWSLSALRSARPDGTWRAGFAGRARWSLWPGRRLAASRD